MESFLNEKKRLQKTTINHISRPYSSTKSKASEWIEFGVAPFVFYRDFRKSSEISDSLFTQIYSNAFLEIRVLKCDIYNVIVKHIFRFYVTNNA